MRLAPSRLSTKIILTFVGFVVPLIALSGLFYYETARRSLDSELGLRLVAVARTAATRFNPLIISSFRPGDETGRTYQSYRGSLLEIRDRTGLKRLFVFDAALRSLLDTEDSVPIGTPYSRLSFQREEIYASLRGEAGAGVLFRGEDGAWYKTGFAAVLDEQGRAVAVIGTDASAGYLELIAGLRRSIMLFIMLGAVVAVGLGYLLARTVSRPVSRLVERAERIGRGRLEEPVEIGAAGTLEMAVLAQALERMRERLSQREENQRLMVAGVAHEIRNPLGGIEMFASLARQELPRDSEAARYLERVIAEVGGLKTIINHFLEFAKPLPARPENLDLKPLVEAAAGLLSREMQDKSAALSIEIPGEAGQVRADPEQLSRVFLNLLSNALEALPAQGGKIEVSVRRTGNGEVGVVVADNGRGIDGDSLKKIFSPFFTTRDNGMGLGLAIVKKSLEEQGGWIEVESRPGEGARFTCYLPEARK